MKKFLLFPFLFALFPSILMAQEPYRQLIITEAVVFDYNDNYTEITNVGDQTINLKEFKYIGDYRITIPEDLENGAWVPPSPSYTFWLPDYELEPGESYVIAPWYDFGPRQYRISPDAPGAVERPMKMDLRDIANKFIHYPEDQGDETDSVTPGYLAVHLWGGNGRIVLEHHFAEDDSAAVDVFNTVDPIDGQGHDVAGIERATNRGPVMRKATVTEGNLDFANARGVHLDDSEWMAIPYQTTHSWRDSWWTIGNHGSYVLDENTLESDIVDIDFAGKTITVPWGIRRLDGIMRTMAPKPGVAWYYHLNEIREDSVYQSVRNGDKLEV